MASNKNKISTLVSDDDDPTAELKALAVDEDELLEADANTFNFKDDEESAAVSELRSDLKDRSETIGRLQFDIEQLRSRWLGLEAEIKSREEITRNLQAELDEQHAALARKQDLINERDSRVKSLKAEIREREELHQKLQQQAGALEETVNEHAAKLAERQEALEQRDSRIDEMQDQIASLQQELDTFSREEIDAMQSKLVAQAASLAGDAGTIRDLERKLENSEHYADSIRQQLSDLLLSNRNAETSRLRLQDEIEESNERIEELSRLLEAASGKIADLTEQQMLSEESHAQEIRTLRFELGEAQETVSNAESLKEQLATELADTRSHKDEFERALSAQDEQNSRRIEELLEEIETLRAEFVEAQESVANSDTLNEQLASELLESHANKDELERTLREHDELSAQRIEELEKEVTRLAAINDEFEQKLAAKSEAVNSLLEEVARKSEQIDSIGEIEQVIHDIDDRMSESIDVAPPVPNDRITRLLVGEVDDQVLRFPLFKDRLTIGRTSSNDIQLKKQYVSRRHAVILTEGDTTRVVDWGSKNGVYVNSKRVTEHFLNHGDVVTIGTSDFRYEERAKRD
ncbi:MAG: FHA domain-containing protein [Woeseiaceae bacterium]|nr:FHA domain-containing protein [Woeseiaceae bacterium]